jgi:taurine---2-oxoglutarate transaminase
VTGTNGVLVPPKGYLPRLHALLQKHGILLICDEVMAGFGRTGKLFAFQHYGIVPDMVTMAKGLTSSYIPFGAVGLSDAIAAHFKKNVFWGGLTYNSHALACATALANLEVLIDEGMIENAARLEGVMQSEMRALAQRHPCVKEGRAIGLFGMIDLQKNERGEPFAPYAGASPVMAKLGKRMKEEGLYAFLRPSGFTCIPPLCITEEELRTGFSLVDKALDVADQAYEG